MENEQMQPDGVGALVADSYLRRLRQIDLRIETYEEMIGVLKHKRSEVDRKLKDLAKDLRRSGGPATLPLANGTISTRKESAKTILRDGSSFREHFRTSFPGKFEKTVLDETAAKKSIKWTKEKAATLTFGKDEETSVPVGDLFVGVDENGEAVPGIFRYVPSEGSVSVSYSYETSVPLADLEDDEEETDV